MNTSTPSKSQGALLSSACAFIRMLVAQGFFGARSLLGLSYLQGEDWLIQAKRATYGLAVTRMLLGIMMFGTLAANFTTRLYTFGPGSAWTGQHDVPTSDFAYIWPVNIMIEASMNDVLYTFLYLLLMTCTVLFVLGYRTRIVLVVLFTLWVGFVETISYVNDQSDNLTRIAMIAMFFTSASERWSLDARRRRFFQTKTTARGKLWIVQWWRFQQVLPAWCTNMSQNFAIMVLACQIFFIYVSGGLYKAGGVPWSAGYAIYNPIHVEQFGTWPELSAFVTTWGPAVALATGLTLLVQISFPFMLLRRGTRIAALVIMLGFHFGIAVLMGLPWFSLAMVALDAIFIRDVTWNEMSTGLRKLWAKARSHALTETAEMPVVLPSTQPGLEPGRVR